jgi:hypothetical protein
VSLTPACRSQKGGKPARLCERLNPFEPAPARGDADGPETMSVAESSRPLRPADAAVLPIPLSF